jgi:hypothetical protein
MPTRRRKEELSTEIITFKVTKLERELIEGRASELGVNRSEAVRSSLISHLSYLQAIRKAEKNG